MYMEYAQEKRDNPETNMKLRINSKGYARVVSGMLNMNDLENATFHEVEEFWVHPGYKYEPTYEMRKVGDTFQYLRSKNQDDIAVLRIEKLNIKYYNPVCLPPKNDDPYAE